MDVDEPLWFRAPETGEGILLGSSFLRQCRRKELLSCELPVLGGPRGRQDGCALVLAASSDQEPKFQGP